jgi:hypothetical protein
MPLGLCLWQEALGRTGSMISNTIVAMAQDAVQSFGCTCGCEQMYRADILGLQLLYRYKTRVLPYFFVSWCSFFSIFVTGYCETVASCPGLVLNGFVDHCRPRRISVSTNTRRVMAGCDAR